MRVALRYGDLPHARYVLGRLAGVAPRADLEVEHIFPLSPGGAWSGDGERRVGGLQRRRAEQPSCARADARQPRAAGGAAGRARAGRRRSPRSGRAIYPRSEDRRDEGAGGCRTVGHRGDHRADGAPDDGVPADLGSVPRPSESMTTTSRRSSTRSAAAAGRGAGSASSSTSSTAASTGRSTTSSTSSTASSSGSGRTPARTSSPTARAAAGRSSPRRPGTASGTSSPTGSSSTWAGTRSTC